MGERRFVRLAVPQTSARQISSIWRINHQRAFPIAERSPAQIRYVRDELIEPRINEINKLQFENRAFAVRRQTAGDTENRRFGKRRIEHLFWKLGCKLLCETDHTTLRIFNVFAKSTE